MVAPSLLKPVYRPTFYAIMALSVLVGTAMNFVHVDPIKALFYVAIINGLVATPLMILIVILGSDKKTMGYKASGGVSLVLVWIATVAMTLAAGALLITLIPGFHL